MVKSIANPPAILTAQINDRYVGAEQRLRAKFMALPNWVKTLQT